MELFKNRGAELSIMVVLRALEPLYYNKTKNNNCIELIGDYVKLITFKLWRLLAPNNSVV